MKELITFLKLLVVLFILSGSLIAQVTQQWVSRYNGTGNSSDRATSLAVDAEGNVYVTGFSYGSGTDKDYATIKYNSAGDMLWVRRYDGPGNSYDYAHSLGIDIDGNVYVTGGSSRVTSGSNYDYATIKYNSAGDALWVRRYNGPGNYVDEAYSLAIDTVGNVYVTGWSDGIGIGLYGYDYATIKYSSTGVQQWVQRYNGPVNSADYAYSLAVDAHGNVYVTGRSYGSGTTYDYDYATIKYNSTGVFQWVQRYDGPGHYSDEAQSLAVDADGNVYVTGWSDGIGSGSGYDYATIKYNSTGVQQWLKRYNGPANSTDKAYSLAVDAEGNVYVTGTSYGSGPFGDYATIKYNSDGQLQWLQRYNGTGNGDDIARSLALDAYGNVYVTGYSWGSGLNWDYTTIKYNSDGVQQWVQSYNGTGNGWDFVFSLTLDANGDVYVAGESKGSGTDADYATIKYSQPVGITPISNQIPKEYKLEQNYPNPFNPTTNIRYDLPKSSFVELVVYDALSKEVTTLVSEELEAGSYQVDWDASGYPSGVYFYRIAIHSDKPETDEFVNVKKMVLVK